MLGAKAKRGRQKLQGVCKSCERDSKCESEGEKRKEEGKEKSKDKRTKG